MQNEESLNLLNQKPGNVKNALVQKLSKQWPLTLKQLDHALKREFGLDVTYQAVHKAMQQLEEEKIVEKTKEGYQLHPEWIQTITKLSNQISQAYSDKMSFDPNKEINLFNFNNWISVGRFIMKFKVESPNPEKKSTICNWIHVWPAISLSAEEAKIVEKIHNECPNYSICPNDTPLDKLFSNLLVKLGNHSKVGLPVNMNFDYVVRGDFVVQIYYENKFIEKIDSLYRNTKNVKDIDYSKLQEIATTQTNIQVIIINSETLAEHLRSETTQFFNKSR